MDQKEKVHSVAFFLKFIYFYGKFYQSVELKTS